ncbi:MAG: hypothetical protein K1X36_01595 [Pyrinomonadaceae bacterium]|nr:hypothetical protein [Pyrinomonadaceae bacterium]
MKFYPKILNVLAVFVIVSTMTSCEAGPAKNIATDKTLAANNSDPSNAALAGNSAKDANPAVTSPGKPFSKTLELHGIKFVVESPNSATGNTVKVTPSGLEVSNDVQTRSVNGEVYDAEVGDLNIDLSPEIYIYVRETGGNKKASLIAYSANKKRSLSEIAIPEVDTKSKEFAGYNGGDEFAVVESTLARRFPIYDGSGADAKKTGKMRQLKYKLKQGEAMWQLTIAGSTEF